MLINSFNGNQGSTEDSCNKRRGAPCCVGRPMVELLRWSVSEFKGSGP